MIEVFVAGFDAGSRKLTMTVRAETLVPKAVTVRILNVMFAFGDTPEPVAGGVSFECDVLLSVVQEVIANTLCASRYEVLLDDGRLVSCMLSEVESARIQELMPPKRGWNWTTEDLIFGEQGFIFFRNGSNRLIDQHQGLLPLPDRDHAQWRENLIYRANLSQRLGIPIFSAVVPNKETIYNRCILGIELSENRAACQIEEIAKDIGWGKNFLRPEKYMIEKSYCPDILYERTTAYWNALGAMHAFNYMAPFLAASLDIEIPLFAEAELGCRRFIGINDWGGIYAKPVIDNGPRFGLQTFDSVMQIDNGIHNRGHCRIYRNPARKKKLLAFCDSFTFNVLWQFLAERFGVVVLAHQSAVDLRLMELVQPDIVLTLTIERFLINPPNDAADPAFLALPENLNKQSTDDLEEQLKLAATL